MARLIPFFLFLLVFCVPAPGATYYVPDDFPTIQAAIDGASGGDTIVVRPGTYRENIDFRGKALTVKSQYGAYTTVIDGGGAGSTVTFQNNEGAGSVLDGFTVTNGSAADGGKTLALRHAPGRLEQLQPLTHRCHVVYPEHLDALPGQGRGHGDGARCAVGVGVAEGRAVYFSRSRRKLWRKGETSGNVQHVKEIYVDCDEDTVLLKVEQVGGAACHTGHRSCFYRRLDGDHLTVVGKPLFNPQEVYGK